MSWGEVVNANPYLATVWLVALLTFVLRFAQLVRGGGR